MIPVPREPPAVPSLNSFYVDLPRLVEHCQGAFGCGCLLLTGGSVLAQLYFDQQSLLGGAYADGAEALSGAPAVQRVLDEAPRLGLSIQVFAMTSANVYLWANVPHAERLYGELSTEFTDLMGLIRKMGRENLSGYIEVCSEDPEAGGVVFLSDGKVVGGSYPGADEAAASPQEELQELVSRNRTATSVFHVGRFPDQPVAALAVEGPSEARPADDVLPAIEELLNEVGGLFSTARHPANGYRTLLNRKFLEKAERYPFLDPFAAEFTYREGRAEVGSAIDLARLTGAVVECLREVVQEQGQLEGFRSLLAAWSARHGHLLTAKAPPSGGPVGAGKARGAA